MASHAEQSPILMEVTRRPQAMSRTPMLLAVTPFPSPLTTPPVTNTYFIFFSESPNLSNLLPPPTQKHKNQTNQSQKNSMNEPPREAKSMKRLHISQPPISPSSPRIQSPRRSGGGGGGSTRKKRRQRQVFFF